MSVISNIQFDTFGENRSAAGGLTATASIIPTGGTDSYLVAGVIDNNNTTPSVTDVTWNGTPMTQVLSYSMSVTFYGLYLYILKNPTITTGNLIATRTSTVGEIYVGGAFYTGVDTHESTATDGTTCSDTSSSISITSTVNNTWGIMLSYNDNNRDISPVTNTFQRGGTYNGWEMFDSNGSLGAAGLKTMSNNALSACYGSVGMILKPSINYSDSGFFTFIN